MNIDELERVDTAIKALKKHGYTEAVEALKAVLIRELYLVADGLRA